MITIPQDRRAPTTDQLIDVCARSRRGFLQAAAAVGDPYLRDFLQRLAAERRQFLRELWALAHPGTMPPLPPPVVVAAPGRSTARRSDAVVIQQRQHQERGVVAMYRAARDHTRSSQRDVIERQYSWIKQGCQRLEWRAHQLTQRPAG